MKTSKISMILSLLAMAVIFAFVVPNSYGQVTTATLSGTVSDELEALIPGVSVTIRNVDTGATRRVVTDDEGRYGASGTSCGNL